MIIIHNIGTMHRASYNTLCNNNLPSLISKKLKTSLLTEAIMADKLRVSMNRVGNITSLLYVLFRVIPRRLNFMCRRIATLFYLHRQVNVERLGLRNVGVFIREKFTCVHRKH